LAALDRLILQQALLAVEAQPAIAVQIIGTLAVAGVIAGYTLQAPTLKVMRF
jgi:hypothetical protein